MRNIKIAVDVHGDHFNGALPAIEGSLQALGVMSDIEVFLVGRQTEITKILKRRALARLHCRFQTRVHIVPAAEIVPMGYGGEDSWRDFPESSVAVGMQLMKDGKVDVFISPGNTAAVSYTAFRKLGRIIKLKGLRPGICVALPKLNGRQSVLLDIGATVDADARALFLLGVMGNAYYKSLFGSSNPSVGLISVGSEPSKGNAVVKEAHHLLKESSLNFFGNIEGRDVLAHVVDVVVCDGFIGNILTKYAGGLWKIIKQIFRGSKGKLIAGTSLIPLFLYSSSRLAMLSPLEGVPVLTAVLTISFLVVFKGMRFVKKFFHSSKYGGAQLLGVNGIVIICHGSSTATAFQNAILKGRQSVRREVNAAICQDLEQYQ